MKKKASQLEFISQINRDGSGTSNVDQKELQNRTHVDEVYNLTTL